MVTFTGSAAGWNNISYASSIVTGTDIFWTSVKSCFFVDVLVSTLGSISPLLGGVNCSVSGPDSSVTMGYSLSQPAAFPIILTLTAPACVSLDGVIGGQITFAAGQTNVSFVVIAQSVCIGSLTATATSQDLAFSGCIIVAVPIVVIASSEICSSTGGAIDCENGTCSGAVQTSSGEASSNTGDGGVIKADASSHNGSMLGKEVGIPIGVVLGVVLLGLLAFFLIRKRRQAAKNQNLAAAGAEGAGGAGVMTDYGWHHTSLDNQPAASKGLPAAAPAAAAARGPVSIHRQQPGSPDPAAPGAAPQPAAAPAAPRAAVNSAATADLMSPKPLALPMSP